MAKKRDVLLGMVRAGNKLAKTPLLINNNWAEGMNKKYSAITSAFRSKDLAKDIAKLKQFLRTQSKAK